MMTQSTGSSCLYYVRTPHSFKRNIVLDTPALLSLTISVSAEDGCYFVENVHHLIGADINFVYDIHSPDISKALSDLLKGISNVQFLKLGFSIEDICIRNRQLPKFPNMTCLELRYTYDLHWKILLELLKNFPRLETLVFKEVLGYDNGVF